VVSTTKPAALDSLNSRELKTLARGLGIKVGDSDRKADVLRKLEGVNIPPESIAEAKEKVSGWLKQGTR
jgi:ribosomal protein L12E/L44/L45/RPP1/RPP2